MVINKDIKPENNLYFTGGLILEQLTYWDDENVDLLELYQKTNGMSEMSMKIFILSIDWLFILGLVKASSKGKIKKCF